jgi:hypothetical protein
MQRMQGDGFILGENVTFTLFQETVKKRLTKNQRP